MFNPTGEDQVEKLTHDFKNKQVYLDIIVNCVGLLHSDNILPEKSIRDFSPESLMEVFRINTAVALLLAKFCQRLVPRTEPSLFVSLSAKVESMEGNKLEGKYSYRTSKAGHHFLQLFKEKDEWTDRLRRTARLYLGG